MMRSLFLCAMLIAAPLSTPAVAGPNPQLAQSIASRLVRYDIHIDPARLTTAQAAALHILLVSERGYVKVRRRAEVILESPQFRD